MMLARLAFITRANRARVGPLETISTIPIRRDFMARARRAAGRLLKASSSWPGLNRGQPQVTGGCTQAHGLTVIIQQRFQFFLQSRIVSETDGVHRSGPNGRILVVERILERFDGAGIRVSS